MKPSIVILGPAHPYRGGGITTFNERLARAFQDAGQAVTIYNFTLQYPSFLFPGKSQYTDAPAPTDIRIIRRLNSVNPINWISVGSEIRKLKPDILLVRFWIPLMGPAFGTVMRIVSRNKHTRIVVIADNVIPHEKRFGDKPFTSYFLKAADAVITMSAKVMNDLKTFAPQKNSRQLPHPLYDNFGIAMSRPEARTALNIDQGIELLLFFGFIRKYKGLDLLLEALAIVKNQRLAEDRTVPKLLIAGEFYEEEKSYQDLIDALGIRDLVILRTGFVEDDKVKQYFCAADVVIQPYRNATQSGVIPVAYHFETPMIVTNVGALPDYVPDGVSGIVCEPEPAAIAAAIERFFTLGSQYFIPQLRRQKEKYSWEKLVEAINELGALKKDK